MNKQPSSLLIEKKEDNMANDNLDIDASRGEAQII